MRTLVSLSAGIAAVVGAWFGSSVGLGQQPCRQPDMPRPAGRSTQPAETCQQPERQPGGRPSWPHTRPLGQAMGLPARLFRLAPEDQGPLRPGEEEDLLAFAQTHMPRFYAAMQRVKERDPQRLRAWLEKHAARVRHLRRLYERSPRLAQIVQSHAENMFEIGRQARTVRSRPGGSPGQQQAFQRLRGLLSRNLELEIEALEALATELETQSQRTIEERLAQLLDAAADLTTEPDELRELVTTLRSTSDPTQRESLVEQLRSALAGQVVVEAQTLRQRSAQLRQVAEQEIERRLERLLEAPPPRPGRPEKYRDGPARRGR